MTALMMLGDTEGRPDSLVCPVCVCVHVEEVVNECICVGGAVNECVCVGGGGE